MVSNVLAERIRSVSRVYFLFVLRFDVMRLLFACLVMFSCKWLTRIWHRNRTGSSVLLEIWEIESDCSVYSELLHFNVSHMWVYGVASRVRRRVKYLNLFCSGGGYYFKAKQIKLLWLSGESQRCLHIRH